MNAPSISPELTDKLSKICGMLGSSHAGERASAGLAADKLLRDNGLSWPDVLARSGDNTKQRERVWREPLTPMHTATVCLKYPEVLTDWEKKFLSSVAGRGSLSQKQIKVMQRVLKKVRAFATGEGA